MSALVLQFEHSLALPFFGIGRKTDIFLSCGSCWVFQICWHIECSTFTISSFRILNSSARIPSGFPGGTSGKKRKKEKTHLPLGDLRDMDSIPRSERNPTGGNGNPLCYSCLGNAMDRAAPRVMVHSVAKSQTPWSKLACMHTEFHHLHSLCS